MASVRSKAEAPQSKRLQAFVDRVATEDLARLAAQRCRLGVEEARHLVRIYSNEAHAGLELIAPLLRPGIRVLEVGCGIGVLSKFLAEEGVAVVGIEPGSKGFGFMSEMAAAIGAKTGDTASFRPLSIDAASLNPAVHGRFDLVFSLNVVEHMVDLDAAFAGMASVLAPNGMMVHQCPNYAVPYEPHFGIPLIPGFPRLTRYLFPQVTSNYPGLWDSLNFVTASRIRGIANRLGLDVHLDSRVMGDAIRRLARDPIFHKRQRSAVSRAFNAMATLGALRLIDGLPASIASPMIMRLTHRGAT